MKVHSALSIIEGVPFFPPPSSNMTILFVAAFFGQGKETVTVSTSALGSDFCEGSYRSALDRSSMIVDVGHASGPIITGIVINLLEYWLAFSVMGSALVGIGALFCAIICPNHSEAVAL
jgi:DHA1 family multidrug resistance protein-like MFS transporter